ncbi:MAG: dihydroorotase [Syntrophobacterales bacterium]
MSKLIRGGRVLDPASGLDDLYDLLIEGDKIKDLGPPGTLDKKSAAVEVIDADGLWVVPGLIDLHTHLREPGEEYKETVLSGSQAAAAGGFTSICCMPNTKPTNDTSAVTDLILRRAAEADLVRVFPVGAISQGQKGEVLAEYAELKEAGVVAVSDDGIAVMNSQLMRVFRDCSLAELTGGRLHIAHVSSAGAVELVRLFKAKGVQVTAEATPHHFTLTDEALENFDTNLKVNPPIRSSVDLTAIQQGLADGTIDAIATDHAPHSSIEKDVEFDYAAFGMIGLETAFPLTLRLVDQGLLSPLGAIEKLTSNPARIIGVDLGRLTPGLPADVSLFDPNREFTVDVNQFRSKSRNSPFDGWQLRGKTVMVLRDGKIIFTEKNTSG